MGQNKRNVKAARTTSKPTQPAQAVEAMAQAFGGISKAGKLLAWSKPTPGEAADVVGKERVCVVTISFAGSFTFTERAPLPKRRRSA